MRQSFAIKNFYKTRKCFVIRGNLFRKAVANEKIEFNLIIFNYNTMFNDYATIEKKLSKCVSEWILRKE